MRVQLWLLQVHACRMRMHLDAYGMPYRKNVVDCAYMCAIDLWQVGMEGSMHVQVAHIQHNVSSAISLSAWCTTFGHDVWPVSCAVYVTTTRPKTNCTRRSIHSRLSPPAGPAPALYFWPQGAFCASWSWELYIKLFSWHAWLGILANSVISSEEHWNCSIAQPPPNSTRWSPLTSAEA